MKKIFFFYTICFFFNLPIYAGAPLKGSLTGTVKDAKTGKPLQGVSITISDIKAGGTTNAQGEFNIPGISEGIHLVEVSHIGYTTIAEHINITGQTRKDFLLSESIVENNAVIVTGVTKATQLKKVPFQVSVLKKDDLLQTVSSNIIESITKKAGVSSLSTGPAISKPLIRGLGYNRVLTINDGVRQEGQQWGDEHGIEIDESSVSKIEVLKGPASLVYGSDAMAGVINIITNVPVQANTVQVNAGTNYQTNNRLRSLNGNVAGNVNGFNWNLYGSIKAAADYKNRYDGYVFNSKFNERNVGGYVGYNGGWGYSHLLVSNFNLKTGLVEGDRDAEGYFIKAVPGGNEVRATDADFNSTNPEIPYQHIRHFKIATDNNFKLGGSRLSLNVGWQRNRREEFGNPDDPAERALSFDLKTITYNAQLHLREMNGWKPSVGFNGMQQDNGNKGVEQLIPDYSLHDIGGFVFVQKDMKQLSFSGGARYDSRSIDVSNLYDGSSIKGNAFSRTFSNFSGSIGLTYQPAKTINLKFNVARAFRAPSIPELASNGAHEGTIRYEYGEQDLKSELSTQLDAAIEVNREHFSVNIAGYFNNFSNFIFYRKLQSLTGGDSTVVVDGEDLTAFKFDQRKAYLTGLEATLDIHPHPLDWLHLENTFSLVSGKLKEAIEGSDNLPFIPAPKLLTEIRTDFKKPSKYFRNLYLKLELENTFRQSHPFTAYNTETATAGYSLLNFGVGTDICNSKGKTIAKINIAATNIADVAYQNHLSRLKYAAVNEATGRTGVYNMGRNFSIKLNIPLSIALKK
ncbi:MAG: TonB-dependent receptor [Bacteroidetes bacterium]|nr:TonB-dependent receptor [Bacteroidota bacterium]